MSGYGRPHLYRLERTRIHDTQLKLKGDILSVTCISVIVTQETQIIENKLLQIDTSFDSAWDAAQHRDELEKWLDEFPIPGQEKRSIVVDRASLLAARLPEIIQARDPDVFGPYFSDPEGDLAVIERRPYDWANLEMVG